MNRVAGFVAQVGDTPKSNFLTVISEVHYAFGKIAGQQ
jgi:hypothetical protein